MAWAALGGAYSLKGSFLSLTDLVRKGVEMERRAIAIDPGLADAHAWLGTGLLGLGRIPFLRLLGTGFVVKAVRDVASAG